MTPEASSSTAVDGAISELWESAREQFLKETKASPERQEALKASPNAEEWLTSFREARHPDGRLEKAFRAMGGHLLIIQKAISAIGFGVQVAASAQPVVAPASFVVNAFAWALASFAKVSEEFDKIEEFFILMSNKFDNLKVLEDVLRERGRKALRDRVVELFACSLRICAIAIKNPKPKLKTWISTLKGDNRVEDAVRDFRQINESLLEVVNISALADVKVIESGVGRIDSSMTAVQNKLDGLVEGQRKLHRTPTFSNKWQELLNWLSPLGFLEKYNDLIDRVRDRPQAGRWLLESGPFVEWRDGNADKLWYTGKPGAGKSVLATIVIRHLQTLPERSKTPGTRPAVAYLYLSNEADPGLKVLLGSIVRQLLSTYADLSTLPDAVSTILRNYLRNGGFGASGTLATPSLDELEHILCVVAEEKPVYIVVDAMDECKDSTRKSLMKSLRRAKKQLKVMVTSRLVENRADLAQGFHMHSIEAHGGDIDDYIDSILDNNHLLREHEQRIKQQVRNRSKGIFLLTRLHMDALEEVTLGCKIEETLQNLPEDPEECYSRAVDRIRRKTGDKSKFAFDVLAWVSYAYRPLSEDELRHLLASKATLGSIQVTEAAVPQSNELSAYCCGLVVFDVKQTARFIHYSAKTFFLGHREILFKDFHLVAAFECAKYLCAIPLDGYATSARRTDSVIPSLTRYPMMAAKLKEFPFATYAGEFLHKHYRQIRSKREDFEVPYSKVTSASETPTASTSQSTLAHSQVIDLLRSLVDSEDMRSFYTDILESVKSYCAFSRNLGPYNSPRPQSQVFPPLHIAVFLGCSALAEGKLSACDVNELDGYKQTALVIAFKSGFSDVAGMLLGRGATVDLSAPQGHVLLLHAAQTNYDECVRTIITSVTGTEALWTLSTVVVLALSPAIILLYLTGLLIGNPELVLLPRNFAGLLKPKDHDEEDGEAKNQSLKKCCRILLSAYDGDSEALAQQISALKRDQKQGQPDTSHSGLSKHVDTEFNKDADGDETSLDCDELVVNKEAQDVERFLTTACFLAVEHVNVEAVSVLLANGVDINRGDVQDRTLLHRATARNSVALVKLLLEEGADIYREDQMDKTALMINADVECEEVLELLLKNGADIMEVDYRGVHEIFRAAAHGKTGMVKFFLKHGVPPSFYGWANSTALHAAAANGHVECVKLLLQAGANPSATSDTGKTPLDFVRASKTLYAMDQLEEFHDECEGCHTKHENLQDMDVRCEQIDSLLCAKQGKTSQELYDEMGEE